MLFVTCSTLGKLRTGVRETDSAITSRQGFSRPSNRGNNQQNRGGSPSPSPGPPQTNSAPPPPRTSPLPNSPSVGSTLSTNDSNAGGDSSNASANTMPLFLHDKLQVFMVKGNYMTLAVKPKAVDLGEWIAHQGMRCETWAGKQSCSPRHLYEETSEL